MDYSSYMTVPTALEFRKAAGGEEIIMRYNHNLAWEGGHLMAERFGGTRVMQDREQMGSMADVELPLNNPEDPRFDDAWWIDTQLYR